MEEEILQNIPGMYMIDDYNWTGVKNFGMRGFFSTGGMEAEWRPDSVDENLRPVAAPDDPYNGRYGLTVDDYFVFDVNVRADKLFDTGFYTNMYVSNLFDEEHDYEDLQDGPYIFGWTETLRVLKTLRVFMPLYRKTDRVLNP